jgi:hypothetical protein
MALKCLAHEPQRCGFVPALGDVALEDLALLVHRSPEVAHLAIDLHVDLVEVPLPMPQAPHPTDPLTADICSKQRTELFHQCLTVSWEMSMPRSASRSSTFRRLSGKRTYIITTRRITSGDELK